ncbi:sigma-B regulation protein RsbU (phosphoserine phosphatase) [Neobacillus niacini]|uniref:SpoIIE family protein phosphatase n=1 Tax=Neobacillus niacini TaxID=86668 RepID=UPI0027822C26|nr:SpoIIE family protein phosphatase [Neobacillus niacini]MDQ1000059.1 sigma-B regulation protein RsbU (phosphoserine phosphatase) [Neobacillus niacini]
MDEQLNHAPCGFLTLSEDGFIIEINQTLLRILNYSQDSLIEQHVNSILTVPARMFLQFYFFPLVKLENRVEEMYISLETSKREEIPVLINAVSKRVKERTVLDCIIIPMRKRNEYENELLLAKKETEQALKAKHKAITELETTLKKLEIQKEELLELNQQNQKYKIETKKELELARIIQETLLTNPINNDKVQMEVFYNASGELSGDIYGIYQIDQYRYGIILLDVMGHGISSALITMTLHSLFQRLISAGLPVDLVMKELDSHLHKLFHNNEEARHYSTAIFLLIDTESQKIDYINAGHPPALWQDPDGAQYELCSTAPPLGTFEGVVFETKNFTYRKGGRLLLYTDGVDPLASNYLAPLLRKTVSLPLYKLKEEILLYLNNEKNVYHKSDDESFILVDLK